MMGDVREIWVIARRELFERARSKWFVGITLFAPIAMVALILIPALLQSGAEGARVEIIDRTGVLGEPIRAALAKEGWRPEIVARDTQEQVEMDRIRDRKINGFLLLPEDALGDGAILYRGDNGSSFAVTSMLHSVIHGQVVIARGRAAQISEDTLRRVTEPPKLDARQTDGTTAGSSGIATYWLGYILGYITMISILVYAVAVMRSVVQEKTTRVMELMVATVKPRALMLGKIIGVGTAGLIQIAVWLTMGALTLAYRDALLGLFDKPPSTTVLPSLASGDISIALAFFLFGYFFYAAMYAAVGAMVSSEQDSQQAQLPVMMLLMVGFACVPLVSEDPRGLSATVLTMLPLWSALLMPMRYLLGGAGLLEVGLSLVILVGSTIAISAAAAKIYRVGVLMYGKRPSFKELVRWLRY